MIIYVSTTGPGKMIGDIRYFADYIMSLWWSLFPVSASLGLKAGGQRVEFIKLRIIMGKVTVVIFLWEINLRPH